VAAPDGSCDKFVDYNDISHIARALDADMICLHPQDGILIKLWVERFKEENARVFYQDKLDASLPGLEEQVILCIQT
jgi:hypothetical protein